MTNKTPKKSILIIDDDQSFYAPLKQKLHSLGYHTVSVNNGEDGLKELEKQSFDLILLDLIMPDGDGFYYLEKFREKHIDSPIAIVSNLMQQEDMDKAKKFDVAAYYTKPGLTLLELIARIEHLLT